MYWGRARESWRRVGEAERAVCGRLGGVELLLVRIRVLLLRCVLLLLSGVLLLKRMLLLNRMLLLLLDRI